MNQENLSSRTTKIFRPIGLELSCDSSEELTVAQQSRNKSIFRVPNDALDSPLRVARANPIQDEEMRESENCNDRVAISPYPFCPSAEEIEERQNLILGIDWREPFEESPRNDSKAKINEFTSETIDFSCYFENVPTNIQDVDSRVDDVSFIYEDDSILEEKWIVLEPVSRSMWDTVMPSSPCRTDKCCDHDPRFSPTQVSVESGSGNAQTPPSETRVPSPLLLKK